MGVVGDVRFISVKLDGIGDEVEFDGWCVIEGNEKEFYEVKFIF